MLFGGNEIVMWNELKTLSKTLLEICRVLPF